MPFDQVFPRSFTAVSVSQYAPPVSGVYGISNAREWIYIGESDNIRQALLHHLQETEQPVGKRRPTGFVFEICDRACRPDRKDRLVLEYAPACNHPR